MLRSFLAIIISTLSFNALSDAYTVECPANFSDCTKFINEKLSEKFLLKYPAKDWKIVIPSYYAAQMGNGSLKSYFAIAVVPLTGDISTSSMAASFTSKKPKKIFNSFKTGADILALGIPDLNFQKVSMFDKDLFRKAQLTLLPIMASEATLNMMTACEKSQLCEIYEP